MDKEGMDKVLVRITGVGGRVKYHILSKDDPSFNKWVEMKYVIDQRDEEVWVLTNNFGSHVEARSVFYDETRAENQAYESAKLFAGPKCEDQTGRAKAGELEKTAQTR